MIKNFHKFEISENIRLKLIKDDRFKTGTISIGMYLPLNKETVALNAILPFILSKSCSKYKNFKNINKKLSDLYGSSLSGNVSKMGDIGILSISGSFLDNRYTLYKEDTFAEMTKLLCDTIFRPNLINEKFPDKIINQEKRQLIELIESEFNDKKIFAKNRCIELMCKDELFCINKYGTKEQVLKLSSQDIYEAWENILKNSKIEIMILGNTDGIFSLEEFKKEFSSIKRENVKKCYSETIESVENHKEQTDVIDISQSKLVLGFRTGLQKTQKEIMETRLMVTLYGATPQSKLFLNVREQLSLCYYCSSLYDRYKGIMMVQSGVEKKNVEKAKTEILNQLEEIKKGNFTQNTLNSIKLSLINNYQTVGDYIGNLENFYSAQALDDIIISPEDCVEILNGVTKEQVIEAANKVTLDAIYTLTNEVEI